MDVILNGHSHAYDIGILDQERVFSYVAAFGLFSAVSYTTSQDYKNVLGKFAYFLEGVKDLLNIQSYHIVGQADGQPFEGNYIFGAISNTFSIGGLLKMPNNPLDLHNILMALNTQNFEHEFLEFHKAANIQLDFEDEVDWSLDGEHAKTRKNVKIQNQKKAIHILI